VRFELTTEEEAVAALRTRTAWLAQLARLVEGSAAASGTGGGAADPGVLMRGFAEWDEATDATMRIDEGRGE
jgi:hypothetical protein